MSRIENKFSELKKEKKKAFISYIMACDPDRKTTEKLLAELPKAGVDLIELGIPFSDPMAEGPTIQKAAERALKTGCNINTCLDIVKNFRKNNKTTPVILMGYYNPVFVYGAGKFCNDAVKAGVDGVIIVDLPPEEENEFTKYSNKAKLDLIRLTTPTTDEKRAKIVTKSASGFVYYISVAGVTGVKSAVKNEVTKAIKKLKKSTKLPICVGFGIKDAKTAKEMVETGCDGIVIGSAFINIIEKDRKNAVANCVKFAKEIKKALS